MLFTLREAHADGEGDQGALEPSRRLRQVASLLRTRRRSPCTTWSGAARAAGCALRVGRHLGRGTRRRGSGSWSRSNGESSMVSDTDEGLGRRGRAPRTSRSGPRSTFDPWRAGAQEEMLTVRAQGGAGAHSQWQARAYAATGRHHRRAHGKPIELKTEKDAAFTRGDEKEGGGEVSEGLTIVMREMTNQRSSRPCIVREARGDASEAATRRRWSGALRRCPFCVSNSVMSRAEPGRGPF